MTDILNKTTVVQDEHVDNNRDLFNNVWWFKNNSSSSVIGDYTPGNHTSLHDISCGWGHAKLTDAHFDPEGDLPPGSQATATKITKALYDKFGSYAGLAQLRTNKPKAADETLISTDPNITTGVTTTDVVMEGIKDHANTGGIDTDKPHQDTIHIISNELLKVENRYHCFVDAGSYTNTYAAQTVTHSGNWGSYADTHNPLNYGDTLTAFIDLNFGNFLSARKWWNQGGKVTLDMNHTGGRDGSVGWNTFMDSFGKLYFSMAGDISGLAYGGVHWQNTNPSGSASSIISYQHNGTTEAYSNAGADLAADFGTSNANSNASGKKIVPYDYGTSYKLLFKAQQASNIYGGGGDSPGGSDPVPGEGAEVFVYGKRNADGSQYTWKVVLDNTKQGTVQDGNAVFKWGHIIPEDKPLTVGAYTANFTAETYSGTNGFVKQSPTGTGGSGAWS